MAYLRTSAPLCWGRDDWSLSHWITWPGNAVLVWISFEVFLINSVCFSSKMWRPVSNFGNISQTTLRPPSGTSFITCTNSSCFSLVYFSRKHISSIKFYVTGKIIFCETCSFIFFYLNIYSKKVRCLNSSCSSSYYNVKFLSNLANGLGM